MLGGGREGGLEAEERKGAMLRHLNFSRAAIPRRRSLELYSGP